MNDSNFELYFGQKYSIKLKYFELEFKITNFI